MYIPLGDVMKQDLNVSAPDKVAALITHSLKMMVVRNNNAILYKSSLGTRNWGDALNSVLIRHLSGKVPIIAYNINQFKGPRYLKRGEPVYSVIGSILNESSKETRYVVWGSGFIRETDTLINPPTAICAVRGPLTRDRISELGFDCPNVLGDPALLYPRVYCPKIDKKYKIGIIPHYVDYHDPFIKKMEANPEIRIINICKKTNEVVDEICSCEQIASSSLHGLIAADSYGIPSAWIKFSDNVAGNDFKFHDYYQSIGLNSEEPQQITEATLLEDIEFKKHDIRLDLGRLVKACPFIQTHMKIDQP